MDEQKCCRYCLAANPIRASFCANCGKTFMRPTSPPSAPPPSTLVVRSAPPPSAPPPSTSQPPSAPAPSTSQGASGYQRPYAPPPKPQRRFRKRYALYGFVVLIVFGMAVSALQGPSQNTQSNASTTPAPSAPSSTGHDPLLLAIATNIQSTDSAYNPTITWGTGGFSVDEHWVIGGVEYTRNLGFTNDRSTANATADFNSLTTTMAPDGVSSEKVVNDGHETQYALAEETAALGHAPTTIKDITWHYSEGPVAYYEVIQYDHVVIFITQNLHIDDPSAPVTP